MKGPFYVSTLWPTALAILMTVTYVAGINAGFTTSVALTASTATGFAAFVLVVGCLQESAGRYRFENLIALWTTAFIAFAPVGPAVYSYEPIVSLFITLAALVAACCFVYLIERYVIAGGKGAWGLTFGILPLGIGTAAALEVGRNDVMAGLALGLVVLLHLIPAWFWERAGKRLKTLHPPPFG